MQNMNYLLSYTVKNVLFLPLNVCTSIHHSNSGENNGLASLIRTKLLKMSTFAVCIFI